MDWEKTLRDETTSILDAVWDIRDGQVVPDADDVVLKTGAVKLNATFLYADLAGSSLLARHCPWGTTAKILRCYLSCSTRLIRAYGGEIRSFDGDRVMGIFVGDLKNTHACSCAREIFWYVENVLGPAAASKFESIKNNNIKIKQCVGVDTGEVVTVRAGIRANNDLIWIGRPPSLAAKLSDIREYPYCVYISSTVFNKLGDSSKIVGTTSLWEAGKFKFAGEDTSIYRTKYYKTP